MRTCISLRPMTKYNNKIFSINSILFAKMRILIKFSFFSYFTTRIGYWIDQEKKISIIIIVFIFYAVAHCRTVSLRIVHSFRSQRTKEVAIGLCIGIMLHVMSVKLRWTRSSCNQLKMDTIRSDAPTRPCPLQQKTKTKHMCYHRLGFVKTLVTYLWLAVLSSLKL